VGYDNTKQKGDEAELSALVFLQRHGFMVSIPFGENTPYDLIAESPQGRLYRVQVRWCSWKEGRLSLSLRRISKNYHKPLDRTRIDTFLAWDGSDAYIVPVQDTMSCSAEFTLRGEPPRNGQKKGIHLASAYRNAIHLLP